MSNKTPKYRVVGTEKPVLVESISPDELSYLQTVRAAVVEKQLVLDSYAAFLTQKYQLQGQCQVDLNTGVITRPVPNEDGKAKDNA